MSKRYKIVWKKNVIISEYRGLKKTENPVSIKNLRELVEKEIFSNFQRKISGIDLKSIKMDDIKSMKQELENEIELINNENFYLKKQELYYKESEIDMEDVRKILSWYHKKESKGTFHLFDEERQLIRKGQLIVPREYRVVKLERNLAIEAFIKQKYKRWKKELSCYFSEWEMVDLMWILTIYKQNNSKEVSEWMKEFYGERVDYFDYFAQKDIEKMLLFDAYKNL